MARMRWRHGFTLAGLLLSGGLLTAPAWLMGSSGCSQGSKDDPGNQDPGTIHDFTDASDHSTPTGGSGGGSSIVCDPHTQYQSQTCLTCQAKAQEPSGPCEAPSTACENDPECKTLWNCTDGCADAEFESCAQKCASQHMLGTEKFYKYKGCIHAACYSECYCKQCSYGDDGCFDCLQSKCGAVCASCDQSADCIALDRCYWLVCTDPDDEACPDKCLAENPNGDPLLKPLYNCFDTTCQAECYPPSDDGGAGTGGAGTDAG